MLQVGNDDGEHRGGLTFVVESDAERVAGGAVDDVERVAGALEVFAAGHANIDGEQLSGLVYVVVVMRRGGA